MLTSWLARSKFASRSPYKNPIEILMRKAVQISGFGVFSLRLGPRPIQAGSTDGETETRCALRQGLRRKLGRPGAEPDKIERARRELAKGIGIGKVAWEVGLGVGTVHRLKREIGRRADP